MPNYVAPVSATARFVVRLGDQITQIAHLLGGASARRRFALLVGDLADVLYPTHRIERELDALEALLSLDHLGDVDDPGCSVLAAIHPADPLVAEICALLDELREHRAADHRSAA